MFNDNGFNTVSSIYSIWHSTYIYIILFISEAIFSRSVYTYLRRDF